MNQIANTLTRIQREIDREGYASARITAGNRYGSFKVYAIGTDVIEVKEYGGCEDEIRIDEITDIMID